MIRIRRGLTAAWLSTAAGAGFSSVAAGAPGAADMSQPPAQAQSSVSGTKPAVASTAKQMVEAARQRALQNPAKAELWLKLGSMADSAHDWATAREAYAEFKSLAPTDTRIDYVNKVLDRLDKEQKDIPAGLLSKLSLEDAYFVDSVRKQVVKWPPSAMPIKVCIHTPPGEKVADYFFTVTRQSYKNWSDASGNKVRFVFVDDPNSCDMEFTWSNDRNKLDMPGKGGDTRCHCEGGFAKKATTIAVATNALFGNPMLEDGAKHLSEHEIGHALGLGHSPDPADCMYTGPQQKDMRHISARDMRMLDRLMNTPEPELLKQFLAIAERELGPNDPYIAEVQTGFGRMYERNKDFEKARQEYEKALALREKDPSFNTIELVRSLARSNFYAHDYAEADKYYSRVCVYLKEKKLNEDLQKVQALLIDCYMQEQKYAEAEALALTLLASLQTNKPHSVEAAKCMYQLAWVYFKQKKTTEAEPYYKRAIALYTELNDKSSNAQHCQEDYQRLLKAQTYEKDFPGKGDKEAWYAACRIWGDGLKQYHAGKNEEALAMYQKAIADYPYDYRFFYSLGNAYRVLQKPDLATNAYRKSTQMNAAYFGSQYNLGVNLFEQGKLDEAKEAFTLAVVLPKSETEEKNMQWYCKKLGITVKP